MLQALTPLSDVSFTIGPGEDTEPVFLIVQVLSLVDSTCTNPWIRYRH
jgi:hypothetical protein